MFLHSDRDLKTGALSECILSGVYFKAENDGGGCQSLIKDLLSMQIFILDNDIKEL